MSSLIIQSDTLEDIADAIREKTGSQATMTPAEMIIAISGISNGGGGASITSANFQNIIVFINDDSSKSGLDLSKAQTLIDNDSEFFYIGYIEEGTKAIAHFEGSSCLDWKVYDYQGNDMTNSQWYIKTDINASYEWDVGSRISDGIYNNTDVIGVIVY